MSRGGAKDEWLYSDVKFNTELLKWQKSSLVRQRKVGSITQHINTDTLLGRV